MIIQRGRSEHAGIRECRECHRLCDRGVDQSHKSRTKILPRHELKPLEGARGVRRTVEVGVRTGLWRCEKTGAAKPVTSHGQSSGGEVAMALGLGVNDKGEGASLLVDDMEGRCSHRCGA